MVSQNDKKAKKKKGSKHADSDALDKSTGVPAGLGDQAAKKKKKKSKKKTRERKSTKPRSKEKVKHTVTHTQEAAVSQPAVSSETESDGDVGIGGVSLAALTRQAPRKAHDEACNPKRPIASRATDKRKENEGDRHGSSKRSNATSVQRQKHDGSSSSSGESPFDSTETALYATVACEYAAYGCPYQGPRYEQLVHMVSADTALAHVKLLAAALKRAEAQLSQGGLPQQLKRATTGGAINGNTTAAAAADQSDSESEAPSRRRSSSLGKRRVVTSDSDDAIDSDQAVCIHCDEEGGDMYRCRKCRNWYHEACDYRRLGKNAQQVSSGRCARCVERAHARGEASDDDVITRNHRKKAKYTVDEVESSGSDRSLDPDEWEEEENTDDREFIVSDSEDEETPSTDDSED